MNDLNSYLRGEAVRLGLCAQWQNEWRGNKTPEELIEMYKRGLDFCIEHDYPGNAFIKRRFDPELLRDKGVFVDAALSENRKDSGVFVVQGHSLGELNFSQNAAATLWVLHDSDITVTGEDMTLLFVHVCHSAKVRVCADKGSRAFVYMHSPGAKIVQEGHVVMFRSKCTFAQNANY